MIATLYTIAAFITLLLAALFAVFVLGLITHMAIGIVAVASRWFR